MKPILLYSLIGIVGVAVITTVVIKKSDNSTGSDGGQPAVSSSVASSSADNSKVAGEYWCRSFNYNGAGGSCSLQRHLILNSDGSYTFGSSAGNFTFSGDKITFDGDMAKRGAATYTSDKQIRWEFSENGSPYTITYYYRQAVQ